MSHVPFPILANEATLRRPSPQSVAPAAAEALGREQPSAGPETVRQR